MFSDTLSLFDRLNAPFPYQDYKYDEFGNRCYVSGQTVAERLNQVLGVGFWKYQGLSNTEKIIQEPNGKNYRVKIYVDFSFYNHELKEWITLIDVGSEQIKHGMNEGDAPKSAITDGMKKCASRVGVASDLYNGLIIWDKQRQIIIVPAHYKEYYERMRWLANKEGSVYIPSATAESQKGHRKNNLTQKLKNRTTSIQEQIQSAWQELAGSLDGYMEWYQKKQDEQVSDKQILQLLRKKLSQKKGTVSAS